MALPPKSFFTLAEIAERWGVTLPDIACYALDGVLQLSVMTVGLLVELGRLEEVGERWERQPDTFETLFGPQPVPGCDLWPVFRNGTGVVTRFRAANDRSYIIVARNSEAIHVVVRDLLVTRQERDRFEAAHGLSIAQSPRPTAPAHDSFTHRNGYSEVAIAGEVFHLGQLQAEVVRHLHAASAGTDPWVRGKDLLVSVGANTVKMVDLFKSKRNWRALIASDGRGRYRLNLPDRPPLRPAHRAYRRLRAQGGEANSRHP